MVLVRLAKGYESSEGAKVKIGNELETIGTPRRLVSSNSI